MSKAYQFSYRCNLISVEEKHVDSKLRQEKSTGDIRLKFDQHVDDDHKNGNAVFRMRVTMLRGNKDESGHDYEFEIRLLVKFSYLNEIPADTDEEPRFWMPLVSDLYMISQDRLKSLVSSMGISGLQFIAPLPDEGYEALMGKTEGVEKD